ncbi:putative metal-dependent membrane protease [Streptococcus pneumoniae]|uniref:CPBP family intramembrane glutamic endopeptidase n=1 Tax=Streptococcus pneumoniae TaxID=1313 RepID=UPI00076525C0|nr:type II CAAX endopeptidase family protein [Streptococcus pneumoniae]MDS2968109.1 type II CAAX endopeptidase family protein [Streptococcus pneumoniae]MDS3752278.1 type II CAAX endopeptidase family protein [Streptococcus pneumoniae]MDS9022742.1 type II CAAX endopeptidase family protein [Streptococcus pneumoniae]CVS55598.1 putative metal-dependent membrane protease [Streptococcus pneumoniae]CWA03096.1 putative metal-dependent membrane protease [Streptococcus pneumoniae]
MKKMKEMKFHLATGLLILTYYLIFNVTSDLDFMVALSDNMYYVFQVLLVLILGTIATIAFVKSEHWKECGRFQFRWSYLGVFLLSFFLLFVWSNLTAYIFPRTQNGSVVVEVATSLTEISYFVTRILYTSIIAPVSEEVVCRGLLMTSLSKVKRYYLDVLVSAAIFGAMHVLQYGWITTDFIKYFGMGLIFCMMFRYTRSIYWAIALHASWNSFLLIVTLLVFGY